MTDIPNTSKSPYYLRRAEGHGSAENAGGARASDRSLRSIPAWDPNYLGSSLLAKRIRKTLAEVEDRINTIATGGVDYALLQQMVNDVLAGMNLEGLNEAQVKALITDALAAYVAKPPTGGTWDAYIMNMLMLSAGIDLSGQAPLVNSLVNGFNVWTGLDLSSPENLIASLNLATLGTGTGGPIDTAAVQALIDTATAGFVTEQFLTDNVGPAIQQAIAASSGRVSDRLTLNYTVAGDGQVVIETNSLVGAQHKVGINFVTQRGGDISIDGNRVLTTKDALEAAGGGIDQAAVEAAVQVATAAINNQLLLLESRIDDLEAENNVLKAELSKKADTEYMQEQFGNFNDLLNADISQTAQLVLAEQAKLQRVIDLLGGDQTIGTTTVEQAVVTFTGLNTIIAENIVAPAVEVVNNRLSAYLNALAGKTDPTPTEVRRALDEIAEYAQQVEQWANQMISDVVDYFAVEISKYVTKDEFNTLNAELEGFANEAVPSMVQSALEDRIPAILDALQTHLENVLAIFGGGGTTGVTPAQITELSAEFARLYATKESLAAYAKLDDGNQEINAGLVKARGIQFTINDEVLVPLDFDDYGTRLSLIPHTAMSVDDAGIVVLHTDLADLVPGKKEA